ncbi:hypothetical protein D3C81_1819750 [compost metagenome]
MLTQQYGRTCRRYDFTTITPVGMHVTLADFNDDQQSLVASLDDRAGRLVAINELALVASL